MLTGLVDPPDLSIVEAWTSVEHMKKKGARGPGLFEDTCWGLNKYMYIYIYILIYLFYLYVYKSYIHYLYIGYKGDIWGIWGGLRVHFGMYFGPFVGVVSHLVGDEIIIGYNYDQLCFQDVF